MPGMTSGLQRAYAVKTLAASANTGPFLLEAKNWTQWTFYAYATGTVSGSPTLTIYGTIDPLTAGALGNPNPTPGLVAAAFTSAGNWFPLIARSSQAEGAGTTTNPITAFTASGTPGNQYLVYDKPLVAVYAATNAFTGGGSIVLQAEAAP